MKKVEQQLIRGLLSGDKSAFDMVFRTYYDTLLFVASSILSDWQLAEEVVQDVFVKLWKTASNLTINISLSSYLTAMVRIEATGFNSVMLYNMGGLTEDYIEYGSNSIKIREQLDKVLNCFHDSCIGCLFT